MANGWADTVTRYDPVTKARIATIRITLIRRFGPFAVRYVSADGGLVWAGAVRSQGLSQVIRIDARSNRVVAGLAPFARQGAGMVACGDQKLRSPL